MNEDKEKEIYFERCFDTREQTELVYDDVLPDYFPDISKVVRVRCTPVPQGRAFGGKTVRCAGVAVFEVYYLSAEQTPSVRSINVPYETELSAEGLDHNTVLTMSPRAEGVSCRLSGPRKYTLRAKIQTAVSASSAADASVSMPQNGGETVELQRRSVDASVLHPCEEKNIKISEDFELPHDMPPVGELIHAELIPLPVSCKAVNGEATYRGGCRLHFLYRAEGEKGDDYRTFTRQIPISGTLAVPGVPDGCPCFAECTVQDCTVRPMEDGMGENRLLEVDFFTDLSACFYENRTMSAVHDAFSTAYAVTLNRKTLHTRLERVALCGNFSVNGTLASENATASVVDTRADAVYEGFRLERGRLIPYGNCTVFCLCRDPEGALHSIVGDVPWKYECDAKGLGTEGDVRTSLSVIECTARPSAEGVTVDLELGLSLAAFDRMAEDVVSSIVIDPSTEHPKRPAGELLLYYPTPGESLFEIARAHHIATDALRIANAFSPEKEDTAAQDRVMLIPS